MRICYAQLCTDKYKATILRLRCHRSFSTQASGLTTHLIKTDQSHLMPDRLQEIFRGWERRLVIVEINAYSLPFQRAAEIVRPQLTDKRTIAVLSFHDFSVYQGSNDPQAVDFVALLDFFAINLVHVLAQGQLVDFASEGYRELAAVIGNSLLEKHREPALGVLLERVGCAIHGM